MLKSICTKAHLFEIRMPSQWQTACGATGMNAKESDYAIS